MIRHLRTLKQLSNLLTALEDDTLNMPDRDVVSMLCANGEDTEDVAILVRKQLAKHRGIVIKTDSSAVRSPLPRRRAKRKVENQIAVLRQLLMQRPELSPQLQAVFTSGRAPSKALIDECVAELIRKGLLSKDK